MKVLQAFSLDLPHKTPKSDAIALMGLLAQILDTEINFTVEEKKVNKKPHVHAYCTVHPQELINALKEWFSGLSFDPVSCYDLNGWIDYITKESELLTAKPN